MIITDKNLELLPESELLDIFGGNEPVGILQHIGYAAHAFVDWLTTPGPAVHFAPVLT